MKNELKNTEDIILSDIRLIIYQTKEVVSKIITSNIASMYWKIGNRINSEMLDNRVWSFLRREKLAQNDTIC